MFAKDIMTPQVITVSPDTSVQEIATLLIEKRISGVPVIDKNGDLVGLVSEGDLVHRIRGDDEQPRSWWLSLLGTPDDTPHAYLKSHGRVAADVMTRDLITARPITSVSKLAELLERNRIKRIPILDGTKLVGIVSRANILQALVSREGELPQVGNKDENIRSSILKEIGAHNWANGAALNIIVSGGAVECWGYVDNAAAKKAVCLAAQNTQGVRSVEDNIAVTRNISSYV
jgi:CBS domain-containing protein